MDFRRQGRGFRNRQDGERHLPRSLAVAVGRHYGKERGLAATGERGAIHRVLGALHAHGMSGALAAGRGALHVPVSRRRLLQMAPSRPALRRSRSSALRCGSRTARWRSKPARSRSRTSYETARARSLAMDRRPVGHCRVDRPAAKHLVPHDARWWYIFGSATMVAFIVQVVTGVALASPTSPRPRKPTRHWTSSPTTRRSAVSCAACITLARPPWC